VYREKGAKIKREEKREGRDCFACTGCSRPLRARKFDLTPFSLPTPPNALTVCETRFSNEFHQTSLSLSASVGLDFDLDHSMHLLLDESIVLMKGKKGLIAIERTLRIP
jgi:hypothetical protein